MTRPTKTRNEKMERKPGAKTRSENPEPIHHANENPHAYADYVSERNQGRNRKWGRGEGLGMGQGTGQGTGLRTESECKVWIFKNEI